MRLVAFLAVLASHSGEARASVIADPSLGRLGAMATDVIRGTVLGSEVVEVRSSGASQLETLTRVRVADALKGALGGALGAGGIVTVRQPGGSLGARRVSVEGTARLADGEDVVLFLQPDGAGRFVLTSLAAAKFSLSGGRASRDLSNLGVAIAHGRGPLVVAPALAEPSLPVPEFLSRVRQAVRK